MNVVRGAIGVNKPADLPSQGVTAAVELDELDADAWRKFFAEMRSTAARAGRAESGAEGVANARDERKRQAVPADPLRAAYRHAEAAQAALGKRDVGASQDDGKWQANIASNQVSGYVAWPPGAVKGSPGTLQARFAQVVIPSASGERSLGQAIRRRRRRTCRRST